jgi:tetrahydromethanopterin S-methyltransferase subunit G
MPVKVSHREGKKEIDAVELGSAIDDLIELGERVECYVEQVSARPGQAAQFQFGVNYGVVLGVLGSLRVTTMLVPSVTWKAGYGLKREVWETNTQWKNRSIVLAKKIFDDYDFKKNDGIAEAALIAFYGDNKEE